nr:hypothetical protein [Tanacetum cinerariifolium]
MSSPNHPTFDIEDDFYFTNTPDYTPASPDYFPASSGNTSSDSSNNSSSLVPIASPTLFHDDPYMKVMQAYYAKESPIPTPIVPPSPMLSPVFNPQEFFLPEELLPPKKKTHLPSLSFIDFSNPSRKQACILVPPSFSVYTPTLPQIFKIEKSSIKMHNDLNRYLRQYDEASKHRAQEDPNLKDRKDDQSSSHVLQTTINVRVLNVHYAKLEKELEREKSKYEMIRQDKIEELEQYLVALVELKRKALVRAGDLADMKNASMLPLGPSTYRNNLPNTFHNDPLNMQVFGDGAKFESNTMISLTNGLDFGDGNTMNGPTNNQYFGDGIKIQNNTMNGPTSRQYFGDGAMIGSNTMNGPTNGLDFGDRIKFQNNTMNGHEVKNIESNMMNGPANGLDFGDGNNHENNTMNGHLDFGDLGLNKFY